MIGNRAADIAPVFAELKTFLRGFIRALDVQERRLAAKPLQPLAGNIHRRQREACR